MQRVPQNTMPPQNRQGGGSPQSQPSAENASAQVQTQNGNGQTQSQAFNAAANGSAPNGGAASPALAMAKRIRSEQGQERARQYLNAMEPFLAPAERAHIAQQLGVSLSNRQTRAEDVQRRPQQSASSGAAAQSSSQQNPVGGAGTPGAGIFDQMPGQQNNMMNQINSTMQMMQALSGFSGNGGGGGKSMMEQMMMMQMLGNMFGKK